MRKPSILVKEISRNIILLKKKYMKQENVFIRESKLCVLYDIREKLQLRKRSREGVNHVKKTHSR